MYIYPTGQKCFRYLIFLKNFRSISNQNTLQYPSKFFHKKYKMIDRFMEELEERLIRIFTIYSQEMHLKFLLKLMEE